MRRSATNPLVHIFQKRKSQKIAAKIVLQSRQVCSSLAASLINSFRDSSNFENVRNFLFIDNIGQSECSRIRCNILIGQLIGCCGSFKDEIRGTPKLEQMNWSIIFGTLLLPQL